MLLTKISLVSIEKKQTEKISPMTNAVGRFFFSVVCSTYSLLNRWHCDCVIAIMNIITNATGYDLSLLSFTNIERVL